MRALTVTVVSASLLLSAASAQSQASKPFVWPAEWSATAPKDAQKGGEYRTYTISDPKTFNPFTDAEADSPDEIMTGGTSGLVVQDPRTDEFIPYMAEKFTVSPDKKTYTFDLRKGMKFSDGQEITADDFVTAWKIHTDKDVGSNSYDSFFIKDKPITVKKLGDYKLQVNFPEPDATALAKLTYAPQPDHIFGPAYAKGGAEAIKKMWTLNDAKNVVSPGAFVVDAYRPGERTTYVKNKFWGEWNKDSAGNALPYLDGQNVRVVKDINAGLAAYLAGQIDVGPAANADQLSQIKKAIDAKQLNATLLPKVSPDASSQWIVWNWNKADEPAKQKLFRDERFRQAMSHIANRDAMVQLVYGGLGTPTYTSVYPIFGEYVPKDLKTFPYNLQAASKLLGELGYKKKDKDGYLVNDKGERIEYNLVTNAGNNQREQLARIFADEAKKVGVKVNFKAVDFNDLVGQLTSTGEKRPFDSILLGLGGGDNIWPFGSNVVPCEGNLHAYNQAGKCLVPKEVLMEKLFYQGQTELDPAKRKQIAAQLLRAESELQPVVYLAGPTYNVTYNNRLQGELPKNLMDGYYGSRFLPLTSIKK